MIARSYGYDSWPKLKAYVDGVTAKRFSEAVRAGDLVHVRAMLKVRPELASGGMLDAVLNRSPEIVRVLMDHGANARAGMYPHRDATSPLTIATERGYDEIVAIISEEEQRRRAAQSGFADAPAPEALFQAIASGDDERAIAMMAASPALVRTTQPPYGLTALHVAAKELNPRLVTWLPIVAPMRRRWPESRTTSRTITRRWTSPPIGRARPPRSSLPPSRPPCFNMGPA